MSLARKVLHSSGVNLLDHGVKFAAIFLLTPIMIDRLGEEYYGIWLLIVSVVTYFHLLDMGIQWEPVSEDAEVFEGRDRETGDTVWTATRVDLVFGSNSQLRALAEVYGCSDAEEKFVHDFVAAWNKVMDLDRFDLA